MPDSAPSREGVISEVDRILSSNTFHGAGRAAALLRFVIERTLDGKADQLKEYTLGAEALGRGAKFDPRTDSIARVEASRLRSRLELYYASEGRKDALRISLPKGSYVPLIETQKLDVVDRSHYVWMAATALALCLALVALWAPWRSPQLLSPVRRFEVDLGAEASLRSTQVGSSSVVLSPDGRRIAFISFRKQVPRVRTMFLDRANGSEPKELAGTEGARGLFFSPDNRWLGYWASGRLWKVPVDGGTPVALCEAQDLLGGSWGDDDTIIAAITTSGLWRIPASGGKPVRVEGIPEDLGPRWPHMLPGGRAVVFSAGAPAQGPPRILAWSFVDNRLKDLGAAGGHARYLVSGHLVWVNRGNMLIAPFDKDKLQLTGKPIRFTDDVATGMYGSAEFDISATGDLVYRRHAGGSNSIIQLLEEGGKATTIVEEPGEYAWPRLSPDGRLLSFLVGAIEQRDAVELRVVDVSTKRIVKSAVGIMSSSPVWSPDGRFLVAPRTGGGLEYVAVHDASAPDVLIKGATLQIPWSFSRKGSRLAWYERGLRNGAPVTFDLWTAPVISAGGVLKAGQPEPYIVSERFELFPAFSPDGKWMAFTTLESGAYEIEVRAFPDSGRQVRISADGGIVATWAPDAPRLFYQSLDGRLMVVDWRARNGHFESSLPRVWSPMMLADKGISPNIDSGPKGRIVALTAPSPAANRQDEHHVTLVMNLTAAMRQAF